MLILFLRILYMCLTLSKLCDDTELLIRLKGIKHLDDIFMPEASQNLNLLSQADYVLLALAMLEDEFHGHCLACSLPPAFIDLIVSRKFLTTPSHTIARSVTAQEYIT